MYPSTAGYKKEGTSKEAALSIDASTLRAKALQVIASSQGLTADEVAEKMNMSVLSIRPRVTELKRMGRIEETGVTRKNQSGRNAAVYRIRAVEGQLQMFSLKQQF